MDIQTFNITVISKAGEQMILIKAFSRPQAKRKLMTRFSAKHDYPTIKNIEKMV